MTEDENEKDERLKSMVMIYVLSQKSFHEKL